MNGFLVAGTNSGCGKTTVTIGLMALLVERGFRLAPFKTGPDFIDPQFHAKATNSISYNLDSFLLEKNVLSFLFQKHCKGKDVAVVEGVMGLFDGMGNCAEGSTAELASALDLPVILVVNCKGLYQSAAAIILGFLQFDTRVNIVGVILNNISSKEQFVFMKQYIEAQTGIICVGYLPNRKELSLESRHLGLIQAEECENIDKILTILKSQMAETIDIDLLLRLTKLKESPVLPDLKLDYNRDLSGLCLGVARDKAFQFYYEDNLSLLRENGAEIIEFSPLRDSVIPKKINALYFGGGYPEVFAQELSSNLSMRLSIKQSVEFGMPVFAECGGLMYLTSAIETIDGDMFKMCDVFNCTSVMTSKLQRFGYCEVMWDDVVMRAHEFHHSFIKSFDNYDFTINKPHKNQYWKCGLRLPFALAGYPHFHFFSNSSFYHKIIDLWMKKTIQS